MRHFCGYSERCHSDVVKKLFDLGVWQKYHDEIIATLIDENYVNEERFAKAFAGGHFRQKQWGRNKIKSELKNRQLSDYCIKIGIKEIAEDAYLTTLQKLFDQKWDSLKGEKNRFMKMKKTMGYLLQKGFEAELINAIMQKEAKGK